MSFLDTEPAAIDQVDYVGPWERFRVMDPRTCLAALREVCRNDAPVSIGTADGLTVRVSLWSVDDLNDGLNFNVDPAIGAAAAVAALPQAWAATYLGDVKLQFELRGMVLGEVAQVRNVGGAAVRLLRARIPTTMYCLPRRRAVRVRHDGRSGPMLRFSHPRDPALALCLNVLDISATGCAARLPSSLPALEAGAEVRQVEVELDSSTFVFTDMTVQHVSRPRGDGDDSLRLGCRWHHMPATAQDVLDRWIRSGKRRRELISLTFD
jgi:hypothetical protein